MHVLSVYYWFVRKMLELYSFIDRGSSTYTYPLLALACCFLPCRRSSPRRAVNSIDEETNLEDIRYPNGGRVQARDKVVCSSKFVSVDSSSPAECWSVQSDLYEFQMIDADLLSTT